jgi:Lon protease-like protein
MSQIKVPLYPLPDVVFFPGTYLTLHVSEDRYVHMVEDMLDGPGCVAITLTRHREDTSGPLPRGAHTVVTIGRVRKYERTDDGRYELTLFGESRGRVIAERFEKPYREVVVELAPEAQAPDDSAEAAERRDLLDLFGRLLEAVGSDRERHLAELRGDTSLSLETLVNAVPSLLNLPVAQRQRLLEMDDLVDRSQEAQRLLEAAINRAEAE